MGDFLLGIQREKMAFGSVFFVSRAVVRGSEILRRVPRQIWCQKNATFSSCPSWYIYTQSLTLSRGVRLHGALLFSRDGLENREELSISSASVRSNRTDERKVSRSISRSLSLVHTGGNVGLRGLVCEPMAWKTARCRAAQVAPYGSTATICKF